MKLKLTRRQFGQLTFAGTVGAGLSYLAKRVVAQTPEVRLYGVRTGPLVTPDNTTVTGVDGNAVHNPTTSLTLVSIPLSLVQESSNVATTNLQTLPNFQFLEDGTTPVVNPNEGINDFTYLSDGTPVVAVTPTIGSENETAATRLIFLHKSPIAVSVSGLKPQEQLASLVATNDGGLLGLVLNKNGTPPTKLVDIDVQTGNLTTNTKVKLPSDQRFSTLAHCPDGTFYAATVTNNGTTNLVKLDLAQQELTTLVQLTLNGNAWNNGFVESLVCAPGGQIWALGALRYETPHYLHLVDPVKGEMTRLAPFNVSKIAISPV